jgi:hypothetical protein
VVNNEGNSSGKLFILMSIKMLFGVMRAVAPHDGFFDEHFVDNSTTVKLLRDGCALASAGSFYVY